MQVMQLKLNLFHDFPLSFIKAYHNRVCDFNELRSWKILLNSPLKIFMKNIDDVRAFTCLKRFNPI